MYYLLLILFFIILYFVFVKLLSSILKGCLVAVLVIVLFIGIDVLVKSSKEPVNIFGLFKVDNFEVIKL